MVVAKRCINLGAMRRANTSLEPPGGYGTMSRTTLQGQGAGCAAVVVASVAAATAKYTQIIWRNLNTVVSSLNRHYLPAAIASNWLSCITSDTGRPARTAATMAL